DLTSCQAFISKFSEFLVQLQTLDRFTSSRSGRRILQHYNLLSTAFFTAADPQTEATSTAS
ncbi:hypothetical protein, partial [Pseudomonas sp. RIT-PI-S]|uniref:hypothetical protein n=1 Tax=Pseudomonas sp. RIT-PI-S TaxID=3035295 RepID=UPI0021D96F8E